MKLTGSHWCPHLGTYAEYAVAPAERVVPIPIGVPSNRRRRLAARHDCSLPFTTRLSPIQPGDEVLVHAGAGGTGLC